MSPLSSPRGTLVTILDITIAVDMIDTAHGRTHLRGRVITPDGLPFGDPPLYIDLISRHHAYRTWIKKTKSPAALARAASRPTASNRRGKGKEKSIKRSS